MLSRNFEDLMSLFAPRARNLDLQVGGERASFIFHAPVLLDEGRRLQTLYAVKFVVLH